MLVFGLRGFEWIMRKCGVAVEVVGVWCGGLQQCLKANWTREGQAVVIYYVVVVVWWGMGGCSSVSYVKLYQGGTGCGDFLCKCGCSPPLA